MANSIENKLSNYQVSEDTKEMFANLSIFAKNCEIKNTKKYDNAEDEISSWMGDLLLRYFNGGINHDDILALLKFIEKYNDKLQEEQNGNPKYYIKSIINLTLESEKDNFSNIDINNIYENSIFKIIVDVISHEVNFDDLNVQPSWSTFDSITKEKYIATALWKLINEKFKAFFDTDANPENIDIDKRFIMIDADNTDTEFSSVVNQCKEKIIAHIFKDENTLLGEYRTLIDTLKEKDKYFILDPLPVSFDDASAFEKLSASAKEVLNGENGENQVFFDLVFKATPELKRLIDPKLSTANYFSVVIPYKELNSEYRNMLDCELSDIILYINKERLVNTFIDPSNGYRVTNASFSLLRSYTTSDKFLYRDFYSDGDVRKTQDNTVTKTTKLITYQYGNPYIARRAAESEIIKYFVGDDYVSNNYGQYNYEKLEIATFLEKYKTIRDYYYKVLLNESFINEPGYLLYEKLFLFFWAIEQTITSKIDNIRNIDTFDLTDIKNFLVSYGLDDLYTIINSGPFMDREIYSKRILKAYIDLIQNKGSRGILDILENIFTVDDKTLKIYRQALIDKETKSSNTISSSYKIIRVDRAAKNILSILKNDETSTAMELATEKDKYWAVNTEDDTNRLKNYHVDFVNTKYIVPEMTIEVSKYYHTSRLLFALIDGFKSKLKDVSISIGEDNSLSIKLGDFVDCFRILYKIYFVKYIDEKIKANDTGSSSNNHFVNSAAINLTKDLTKVYNFNLSYFTKASYWSDLEKRSIPERFLKEIYDNITNIIRIDDNNIIMDFDRRDPTFLSIYLKYCHSINALDNSSDTINYFLKSIFLIKGLTEGLVDGDNDGTDFMSKLAITNADGVLKITFIILSLFYKVANGNLNSSEIKQERSLYEAILLFFDKLFVDGDNLPTNLGRESYTDMTEIEKGLRSDIISNGDEKRKIDVFDPSYRYSNSQWSGDDGFSDKISNILASYSINDAVDTVPSEDIYSVLIGMMTALDNSLTNFNIMLGSDDVKLSEFLRQTIVYFISYTSEVYNSTLSTVISYNSRSETYEVEDGLTNKKKIEYVSADPAPTLETFSFGEYYTKDGEKYILATAFDSNATYYTRKVVYDNSIKISTSLADSFFYDEELFIKK